MAFPKLGEIDTTTLRNRAIAKRKGTQSREQDPTLIKNQSMPSTPRKLSTPTGKSPMEIRKTGKIAGSLPPESPMGNGEANPAKFKKKKFDEGPEEDTPFGGMSGFRISIGGFGQPEDPKAVKNREKRTGTTTPMYIQNEKSAKSQHSPEEWNEDKRQAKKMGVSPSKYDTYENNTVEQHRKSVRGSIKNSIKQLKGR